MNITEILLDTNKEATEIGWKIVLRVLQESYVLKKSKTKIKLSNSKNCT